MGYSGIMSKRKLGYNELVEYISLILIKENRPMMSGEIHKLIINQEEVLTTQGLVPAENYIKTILEAETMHNRKVKKEKNPYLKVKKEGRNIYFYFSDYDDKNFLKERNGNEERMSNIMIQLSNYARNPNEQSKWSNKLKSTWGMNCQFCGLDFKELIQGSHIDSQKIFGFFDEENGIPLCKNCHGLFDSHKITINSEDFSIEYSREIKEKYLRGNLSSELNFPKEIDKNKFRYFLNNRNNNK